MKQNKNNNNKQASRNARNYSRPNRNGSKKGLTKEEVTRRNDRKDVMVSGSNEPNNQPEWYYTDKDMMEAISKFPMNQFPGRAMMNGDYIRTVMQIALAPHLVNTDFDFSAPNKTKYLEMLDNIKLTGINLATQKWWTMLTTFSGRGSTYTKNDIAILFGAIGEVISTYEYIRRAFGLMNTYSNRNRALPRQIYAAMGVDFDDLMQEAPNYRIRMNTIIAMINQLPIPSNIAYFAKCQDLYQHVYMDAPSDMAQFYVHVPAITWTLKEGSIPSGSVLETTDFVYKWNSTQYEFQGPQKLSVYIDTLKKMVDRLLSSSTYSIIYSDILNVVSKTSGLTLWTFDAIKEDYVVVPEFNEFALSQIHNTTYLGPIGSTTAQKVNTWSTDHYTQISTNDVVCDPNLDVVIQATPIKGMFSGSFNTTSGARNLVAAPGYIYGTEDVDRPEVANIIGLKPMADFHTLDPDIKLRVDSLRYVCAIEFGNTKVHIPANGRDAYYRCVELPDHFCCGLYVFAARGGSGSAALETVYNSVTGLLGKSLFTDFGVDAFKVVPFDEHPPVYVGNDTGIPAEVTGNSIGLGYDSDATTLRDMTPLWNVDCWTTLDHEWLQNVNDAVYVALFDVR